eukprot:m.104841 g.104841  ORF g.104841 m.104841 type:complete len:369 (+) comp37215_c0_seq8:24-1130(+)
MGGFSFLYNSSLTGTVSLVLLYTFFAACRVLLIRNSSENKSYKFLPMSVNVQSEFLKLIMCGSVSLRLVIKDEVARPEVTRQSLLKFVKWAVPGFLYFLDNLLSFYVLARLTPAVASLLNNFVIITTAVLFRLVLKRKLSRSQWAALAILFCTIVAISHQSNLKSTHHHSSHSLNTAPEDHTAVSALLQVCKWQGEGAKLNETTQKEESIFFKYEGHIFILISCFLSSLANIYNEKIFKEAGGMEDSIFVQNTKLYMFGFFFGVISILLFYHDFVFGCGFYFGYSIYSVSLIFVVGFLGLIVSLILKFRDNMFHVLASQFTTVVVIVVSWISGDFEPTLEFFLMAPVVILSIYLFNAAKQTDKNSDSQ